MTLSPHHSGASAASEFTKLSIGLATVTIFTEAFLFCEWIGSLKDHQCFACNRAALIGRPSSGGLCISFPSTSTCTHTARLIFGGNSHPQKNKMQLIHTDNNKDITHQKKANERLIHTMPHRLVRPPCQAHHGWPATVPTTYNGRRQNATNRTND